MAVVRFREVFRHILSLTFQGKAIVSPPAAGPLEADRFGRRQEASRDRSSKFLSPKRDLASAQETPLPWSPSGWPEITWPGPIWPRTDSGAA